MGRIQSIQSFGTAVDGPGTRCVVFLQGCPVGCLFCHNPGAWAMDGGVESDVEQLLGRLERFRPFLQTPGLTISGGEPMAQPEFTLELIQKAKSEGWHVALDTSGWGPVGSISKSRRERRFSNPLHQTFVNSGKIDPMSRGTVTGEPEHFGILAGPGDSALCINPGFNQSAGSPDGFGNYCQGPAQFDPGGVITIQSLGGA